MSEWCRVGARSRTLDNRTGQLACSANRPHLMRVSQQDRLLNAVLSHQSRTERSVLTDQIQKRLFCTNREYLLDELGERRDFMRRPGGLGRAIAVERNSSCLLSCGWLSMWSAFRGPATGSFREARI